jgi:hypothetical protein
MSDFLLTVVELAPQARLNAWTLRRYCRDGVVEAKLIGGRYVIRASDAAKLLGYWPEKPEPQQAAAS